MEKVFVTGPDGLLGSNVVRELLLRNYQVVAMVLKGRIPVTLSGLPIQIVYGDITVKDEVVTLSKGCDYFVHIAAITDMWPSKGAHYFKVNVQGTENAVDAALINKVKRFIHVGSASSFGFGTIQQPGNEMTQYKSDKYQLDYLESKKEGQELVMDAIKNRNLPAIIVCPTFMIGPYDTKPSSGAMVLAIARKKLPSIAGGGKNWVPAKDVAFAICNALTRGTLGSSYILGGQNLSFKDAVKKIALAVGQKNYPTFEMPDNVIKGFGWASQLLAKLTGTIPKLSYPMAVIACDGHYFSPEKAVMELGLPQTPIEEAAIELKKWFEENGYL